MQPMGGRGFAGRSVFLLLLFATVGARGSTNVATIAGKVVDENGVAVAAVQVRLLRGSQLAQAESETSGAFRLEVDAGEWSVGAQKPGYFAFQQPAVVLHAGQNTVTITLNHQQDLADSVNVTYSAPRIDPRQTTDTHELTSVEILEIPYAGAGDVRRALPLLPGVVLDAGGNEHVNGGTSDQTRYTLNGFNLADPATGRVTARLNIDAVQTIELKSTRFAADTGRGSAGVVDIKTEMGGDEWRWGATNFFPGVGSQGFRVNKWTPRLKFSGPLLKGRLWFDNSAEAFYSFDTVSGVPRGQNSTTGTEVSNLSRVQANLHASNVLTISFLMNYGDDRRQGLSFLNPAETTVNQLFHRHFTSLHDVQYFRNQGVLEAGVGDSHQDLRVSPQGQLPFVISPSGRRGNYFEDQTRRSYRQEAFLNYTFPRLHRMGTHEWKIGSDLEYARLRQLTWRHDYRIVRADATAVRSVSFSGSPNLARSGTASSVYLMDRWAPAEALLIEVGARADHDSALGRGLVSPRLSAAYSPAWLHGTKLSGGYGVFYDAVPLGILAQTSDQTAYSTFFLPGGAPGSFLSTAFRSEQARYALPRHEALSFTVERELFLGLLGRAGYTQRRGTRQITFNTDFESPAQLSYLLQNSRRDRYTAVEVSLRRTFAQHFEWFASYTRSSSRANSIVDYTVGSPLLGSQSGGPYSWDAPDRALFWTWAPVPRNWFPHFVQTIVGETYLATLGEYHTGFPFNVVDDYGTLSGAPNRLRFPGYYNLNVSLERRFLVKHSLFAWRVGVNNVTNSLNPNVVNNDINSAQFLSYGRGQARAVAVRLRFLGRKS
jgi:hypothetical protein